MCPATFTRSGVTFTYPVVTFVEYGKAEIEGEEYTADIFILTDGTIKERDRRQIHHVRGTSHIVLPQDINVLCSQGDPDHLFIGAGAEGKMKVSGEAKQILRTRDIRYTIVPNEQAAEAYNKAEERKALMLHLIH